MALKKSDEKVTKEQEAPEKTAEQIAAEAAATGAPSTTAPAVVVEPTEPAKPAVVEKTPEELQAEKDAADEQARQRLADEEAVREQAGKPAKKRLELVPVQNLRPTAFMQASTGKWIQGGATENLLDDGWLENHVKAGLLKRL